MHLERDCTGALYFKNSKIILQKNLKKVHRCIFYLKYSPMYFGLILYTSKLYVIAYYVHIFSKKIKNKNYISKSSK
jgi:hypothetical protein